MSTEFSRIDIATGREIFSSFTTFANRYSVVFEKPMDGVPTVNVVAVNSNQNVAAVNVTRTGFDIILSKDWCNESTEINGTFEVHYRAYFVR